ncbi:hypothetical protein D3C77_269570 [compost metagenome]
MFGLHWLEHQRDLSKVRRAEKDHEANRPQEPADDWEHYVRISDSIYEWRQLIATKYLERKAEALLVPLPDRRDKSLWERVDFDNDPSQPSYLTQKGVLEARKIIRDEEKARREAITFWVAILFGAGGMVTGIISALKPG